MRNLISKGFAAAAALSVATATWGQETVSLSFDQAKTLAYQLAQSGKPNEALQIANGLMQAGQDDWAVWVVRAAALNQLQQYPEALSAARTAYRRGTDKVQKYQAARIAANANYAQERYSWSQYWLRLARENAPTAEAAQVIANQYRSTRQVNPWSFNAGFGIAPSDNINGGSTVDRIFVPDDQLDFTIILDAIFGDLIQFDAETQTKRVGDNQRALSGMEANLNLGAQYRLAGDATSATFVSANASAFRYRLSDEAKELSSTSENSDFDRDSLTFGLRHVRVLEDGMRPATFALTGGKNFYGGDPSNRYVSASVSQPYLLSDTQLLTLRGTATVSAAFSDEVKIENYGISAQLLQALPWRDRVTATIGANRSVSANIDSDYQSLSLGLDYTFARPIAGMGVSLSSSASYVDVGATEYGPNNRIDRSFKIGAKVTVPQAEIYGFQPVVSFGAERTASTVDQFDSEGLYVGLDFRSSF